MLAVKSKTYTVDDYFNWPNDIRCELIDGKIYDMSPAPTLDHQDVTGALYAYLRQRLRRKKSGDGEPPACRVFTAQVDVVLSPGSVFQPDVAVVCDPAKMKTGKYIEGAPDLVAEVLSPATALKDRREKKQVYQSAGVSEYLIIDPVEHYAEYFQLQANGVYGNAVLLGPENKLSLSLLTESEITLAELFDWVIDADENQF